MIAVIDETTPEANGRILYVVASAIIFTDADSAREAIAAVLPSGRKRPFHWHDEGPLARQAMIRTIKGLGVMGRAHVCVCGRRGQEAARASALRMGFSSLLSDGWRATLR
jgi:hypothetical protein